MKWDYIIVQAGGKGTRMQHLTRNKPKALVPIENRPMLFHLFELYPEKRFIIIGDYKFSVLEKYLAAFAPVNYTLVNANGKRGTCSGLNLALKLIPRQEAFLLIWSDLILDKGFDSSQLRQENYVGISQKFECRWKYENNQFVEERSRTYGVAGLFLFKEKGVLDNLPEEGEFVKWLSFQPCSFLPLILDNVKEYGLLSEYERLEKIKCRPFNRITLYDDYVLKEGIDAQGLQLGIREKAWYEKTMDSGYKNLPHIYSLNPLKLERIHGKNIYEYTNLSIEEKGEILKQIIGCLKQLHECGRIPYDGKSYRKAYLGKTFERLEKVKNLIPFSQEQYIVINGKKCRNVFFYEEELIEMFDEIKPDYFVFLHGDCTFSNIMLREDTEPVLIDPRGYFGDTEIYGDEAYDWAKLYYSIVGNYDQFNLKRFSLSIEERSVRLQIDSSGWEPLEELFWILLSDNVNRKQIKLIHAIIWLSLTTYAWEDYDSICGAFYNGIQYLEEVL